MSTGKRLAKRSIIGTRVCAPFEDGKYYSGIIQAVKTPASTYPENNNCINLTPNTRYTVKFDNSSMRQFLSGVNNCGINNNNNNNIGRNTTAEFMSCHLFGPGFRPILDIELVKGQKVYVTYNGREVCGDVIKHNLNTDEVIINICPPGAEVSKINNKQ